MASPPLTSYLFFWNHKSGPDNLWHPLPFSPTSNRYSSSTLPPWLRRLDPAACCVDAFPAVALSGFLTHFRQLPSLGLEAPWSPFRNKTTMRSLHLTSYAVVPLIFGCQALGLDYRYAIPRWAGERERRRDEQQARNHVESGMLLGGVVVIARSLARIGPRWSLMDVVIAGGLGDLLLREWYKAHEGE